MSRLYKRDDGIYYFDSRVGGQRTRKSTHCTDRRAAQAYADQWERAAADPKYATANQTTVQSACERLVANRIQHGRAQGTINMYVCKVGHLVRVLGADTPLARVNAVSVDKFIETRLGEGACRNTIGKELTALRMLLKVAKRRGEWRGDVVEVMPVQWSTGYKPRRTVLRSAADLQALVNELSPERGAHVCFFVATGARDAEAQRAQRSDIDLERGVVRIRGTKTESSDDSVAVVAFMMPLLEHVLAVCKRKEGPLFDKWGNQRRALTEACARAKIPTVTANDLRRTHATWLRAMGVELGLVARQLRHKDTRMVERVYGRLDASTARLALSAALGEKVEAQQIEQIDCASCVPFGGTLDGVGGVGGVKKPGKNVPRDGIEPPARGFSVRPTRRLKGGKYRSFDLESFPVCLMCANDR